MFKTFAFGFPLGHGDWCASSRGRWGWGGFDGFAADFWGPRGRQHRGRPGRIFEQGDLKYVILQLLQEKPRHGYEIIKDLEDRFGGAYSPSPGTVYPTLTMLEDLGYAKVVPDASGRKVYEITPEGTAYLAEHSTTVENIFDRIARFVEGVLDTPMMEVNQAFRRVGRAAYGQASKHVNDKARLQRIREVLERAAADLETLDKSDG
ncbi:MAG TPA: PadR family transcriptional regulator [Gemmatimonadaceae bacterium]|nr:PadR family transcriptional regulator [Gemmatimonadaceae bacterium]